MIIGLFFWFGGHGGVEAVFPEVGAGFADYYTTEENDGDEVGDCHEGVRAVADVPHEFEVDDATQEYEDDEHPAVDVGGDASAYVLISS